MSCLDDSHMKPQKEEGILSVEWVPIIELAKKRMYTIFPNSEGWMPKSPIPIQLFAPLAVFPKSRVYIKSKINTMKK